MDKAAHDCTSSPTPPKASPYAILAPFSGLEADVHGLESMAFLAITAFEHMIEFRPRTGNAGRGLGALGRHSPARDGQAVSGKLCGSHYQAAKAAEGDRVRS